MYRDSGRREVFGKMKISHFFLMPTATAKNLIKQVSELFFLLQLLPQLVYLFSPPGSAVALKVQGLEVLLGTSGQTAETYAGNTYNCRWNWHILLDAPASHPDLHLPLPFQEWSVLPPAARVLSLHSLNPTPRSWGQLFQHHPPLSSPRPITGPWGRTQVRTPYFNLGHLWGVIWAPCGVGWPAIPASQ